MVVLIFAKKIDRGDTLNNVSSLIKSDARLLADSRRRALRSRIKDF
jgi:hypothetical protein